LRKPIPDSSAAIELKRRLQLIVDSLKSEDISSNEDIQRFYEEHLEEIFEKCKQIMTARRRLYGDAWITMPVRTLQHVIAYKARRLTLTRDRQKMLEELVDIVNLSVFAYARLKQITLLSEPPPRVEQ